jgi:hypothetical protein
METVSLCAELAFRTRVSMSAIGSVMVMVGSPPSLTAVSSPYGADLRCRRGGCAYAVCSGEQERRVRCVVGGEPAAYP